MSKLLWAIWAAFDFAMCAITFWWAVNDDIQWWWPMVFFACGGIVVMVKFPKQYQKFVDLCEKERPKE